MILEDNPQEPAHIERGMADPTKSTSLHLVCRGIHRQQGDGRGAGLPITINLLQVLKEQLRISAFLCHTGATGVTGSVCCGFFRASELMPSLCWSTIALSSAQMSVTLVRSKTDPFSLWFSCPFISCWLVHTPHWSNDYICDAR